MALADQPQPPAPMLPQAGGAPLWVRLTSAVTRRMPVARYRAANYLMRFRLEPFMMALPQDVGSSQFVCDLRDSICGEACFAGRYEPQETALLQAILRPGMTFLDIGANWGYFSLLAAHVIGPAGHIIALEPNPRLFGMLARNVAANQLDRRITALCVAAAAQSGKLLMVDPNELAGNWGLSHLADPAASQEGTFGVQAVTVDSVTKSHGLNQVDLVKLDIEGAEGLALQGMSEGLGRHLYRRILLELHPAHLRQRGESPSEILKSLQSYGYQLWRIDHSRAATKRAAYRSNLEIRAIMSPLGSVHQALDDWPHVFCIAPGIAR